VATTPAPGYVGNPGKPTATACAFVAARTAQLGLTGAHAGRVETVAQRNETELSVFHFEQIVNGAVSGGGISVTVAADGRMLYAY